MPTLLKNLTKQQCHICPYCSEVFKKLTKDHIVPKSKGGRGGGFDEEKDAENIVAACYQCNTLKSNDHLIIFLAKKLNRKKKYVKIPKKYRSEKQIENNKNRGLNNDFLRIVFESKLQGNAN